ncbi:protein kinase 1B [Striga asiatica]|uniref:Protein kinase 1B n=1 Tax=Striga asiatica TaxID=4170 RepID=A0A5A7Q5Q0_STRAF|nr:protein kinase 1B [Striga asiatica]
MGPKRVSEITQQHNQIDVCPVLIEEEEGTNKCTEVGENNEKNTSEDGPGVGKKGLKPFTRKPRKGVAMMNDNMNLDTPVEVHVSIGAIYFPDAKVKLGGLAINNGSIHKQWWNEQCTTASREGALLSGIRWSLEQGMHLGRTQITCKVPDKMVADRLTKGSSFPSDVAVIVNDILYLVRQFVSCTSVADINACNLVWSEANVVDEETLLM